jgi:hypothetical protein
MKIITQKQRELAIGHLAELLKRDGQIQTKTVQEWLDDADHQPSQFQCSLAGLEVLDRLGFGDELVQPEALG